MLPLCYHGRAKRTGFRLQASGLQPLSPEAWSLKPASGIIHEANHFRRPCESAVASPVENFADLLSRARQGDEQALRGLAEQYEREVRIVARVQLGPALRPYLDSIDLVQSVHRSLLMGIRQNRFDISSPSHLIALALTLVRRKVARHWRRLQRQQRLSLGPADRAALPDLLATLSTAEADPAQAAQLRDALRQLWDHIDDAEKRVMELRLQGFSTVEIARQLGLDADVLRVRLSRLRQRLRAKGVLAEWL